MELWKPALAHYAIQTGSGRGGKRKQAPPRRNIKRKRPFKDAGRPKAGRYPAVRIGRQMGVYGKPGRKPAVLGSVRRTIDKTLTSTQQDVNYVGFTAYGSTDEIVQTFCMQVWKDIFQRAGSPLSSWQGRVRSDAHSTSAFTNRLASVTFFFQRDVHNDVDRQTAQRVFATSDTAEDLVSWLEATIKSQYHDGYLPRSYALEDASGVPFVTHETWGDDIVTWNAQCEVKLQNITPAGGTGTGSTDINDINANPLQGKVYDFRNGYMKLRPDYLQMVEASNPLNWGTLKEIQNVNATTDLISVQHLRETGLYANELAKAFQTCPRGPAVFSNLEGVKNIQMPPGGFQVIKRNVTSKCSVVRFIWGAFNSYLPDPGGSEFVKPSVTKPVVNKVILVGLEPTVRSTTDEIVKVLVNRRIMHSISIRKKKPSNLPVAVDILDAVDIGQTIGAGAPNTNNPDPVYGDGQWLCPAGYTYNPATQTCDPI